MNKMVLILTSTGILALTACQSGPRIVPFVFVGEGVETVLRVKPNSQEPEIFVDETGGKKRIVVDQEPIYAVTDPHDGKKKIKFKLQQGYKFAPKGIEICPTSPPSKVCQAPPSPPADCQPQQGGGRVMHCSYNAPPPDTKYFYTIRLIDEATGATLVLDPSVWN